MDLVVEFPRTQKCYNSIWVIIDRITKFANFLHVKRTYTSYKYAWLYVDEIESLHGVYVSITSKRDPKFLNPF